MPGRLRAVGIRLSSRGIQRRAPLTPRPMNGTSTSTSSTIDAPNSHGAHFSHCAIGTCSATSAATNAMPSEMAWRVRKWVDA